MEGPVCGCIRFGAFKPSETDGLGLYFDARKGQGHDMIRRIVVRCPTSPQPSGRSFHFPVGTTQGRRCSIADLVPGQTERYGRIGVISTHGRGKATTWYEESSLTPHHPTAVGPIIAPPCRDHKRAEMLDCGSCSGPSRADRTG